MILPFVLHEPRRARAENEPATEVISLRVGLRTLWAERSFALICVASGLSAFAFHGFSAFLGSLYLRTHGVALAAMSTSIGIEPTALLGLALGLIVGLLGGAGTLIGGLLADRIARRGAWGYLVRPAVTVVTAAPLSAAFALAGDVRLSLVFLGAAMFCHTMSYGPVYAAVQTLAAPRLRGMAVAIQILFVNLIGLALGPLFVGMMNDGLTPTLGASPKPAGRHGLHCIAPSDGSVAVFQGSGD